MEHQETIVFTGKMSSKKIHWTCVKGHSEHPPATIIAILQPSPFVNFARSVNVILQAFKENSEQMTEQSVHFTTRPVPGWMIQSMLRNYFDEEFEKSSQQEDPDDGFKTGQYTMTCSFSKDMVQHQVKNLIGCIAAILSTLVIDIAPLCADVGARNPMIMGECTELAGSLVYLQERIRVVDEQFELFDQPFEMNYSYPNTKMLLIYLTSICNNLIQIKTNQEESVQLPVSFPFTSLKSESS
jgi:hypothetical protein